MPADPRRHLPLKPVDLQLLLALAGGERHGYGLVQAIAEATDGLVQLDPGNLYRVVKRLLADELVGESARRVGEAAEPGTERRRYYALTPLGRQVLTAELRRLEALVRSPTVRTLVRGVPGWAA
jgi:DNA-binding PadR family transcriptional regulator